MNTIIDLTYRNYINLAYYLWLNIG